MLTPYENTATRPSILNLSQLAALATCNSTIARKGGTALLVVPGHLLGELLDALRGLARRVEQLDGLAGHVERLGEMLAAAPTGTALPTAPSATPSLSPDKQYVDLDQVAAIVQKSKQKMERHRQAMPRPARQTWPGRKNLWRWSDVRPWLENEFRMDLPEVYPQLTRSADDDEDDSEIATGERPQAAPKQPPLSLSRRCERDLVEVLQAMGADAHRRITREQLDDELRRRSFPYGACTVSTAIHSLTAQRRLASSHDGRGYVLVGSDIPAASTIAPAVVRSVPIAQKDCVVLNELNAIK